MTSTSAASETVSGSRGVDHHRQQAGALLAGGLGDQLFGPVAEADDAGAFVGDGDFVAQRLSAGQGRTQRQGQLSAESSASTSAASSASSSSSSMSTPASPEGTSPKAVSARVTPADVRVGEEHLSVAGFPGRLLQRRPGIGDHDDPRSGVHTGVGECLFEDPALANLSPAWNRTCDDTTMAVSSSRSAEAAATCCGSVRVEHGQFHPGGIGDDFGSQ